MKQLGIILSIILISNTSFGQEDLIPRQYQMIKEVYGDLNKDGVEEKVVVYNMTDKEDEVNGVDREVVIFRKNQQNWTVWHRSTKAVGNSKDGGMMGDPFEDIEIRNGVLLIRQSGGSSWKWAHTDKYRFQNNRFELIGYTSFYGRPCDYWEELDFNTMTGKIIFKKEYENCDTGTPVVYKKENENFTYKLKRTITLENRTETELTIVSPTYKHEIYL